MNRAESREQRAEYGSDYHFPDLQSNDLERDRGYSLYGTGRDALCSLIKYGMKTKGWKRIWMPSYNCQDVVAAVELTGIKIMLYDHGPVQDDSAIFKIEFQKGDVLLRLNYFGLSDFSSNDGLDREKIEIIEDHSHDPWSNWAYDSDADYCFASIRKTLPVPDGGILWSPKKKELPEVPSITKSHYIASLQKLSAMLLKEKYFTGVNISHAMFRELFVSGEHNLCVGNYSGPSPFTVDLMKKIPIQQWRERRKENFTLLSGILSGIKHFSILKPENDDMIPFSCILVFKSGDRRDKIRKALIKQKIYTAVLWPLGDAEGIPQKHLDLSEKLLSIPCDNRYDEEDMEIFGNFIFETFKFIDKTN